MKSLFKSGNTKIHTYKVRDSDVAQFESGMVHPVCSTFALTREMEWSSRLFVLEMKEDHEEGIGTFVQVNHQSPALVGDELHVKAIVKSIIKNELICKIEVKAEDRLVATGETGQKILPKEKIEKLFASLR